MGEQAEHARDRADSDRVFSEVRGRLTREIRRSADFETELTQARIENAALHAQLAELQTQHASATQELATVRAERDQIVRSRIWRYSRPLRNLRGRTQ